MKNIMMLMIASFFLVSAGCSKSEDVSAKAVAEVPSKTQTIAVGVEGMTCQGCASSIETAIAAVDGVVEQKVNLEANSASITFDPSRTDTEKLVKVIGDAGYTVSVN
ncbi:MAG: heavy-metal-associated domain-containing protein [Calditrichia bacterium]